MAHRIADRVKETASTAGTGSFTLAGAASGFVDFASALTTNGDTTWYCAVNGSEWEVGLGTRTSSTVLARTTIIASSNAGSVVNFTTAPVVFGTVPGGKLSTLGPACCAYRGTSNQSITANTLTKVQLNAEEFDTAGCFDSTTNYRFTPNVAGYYQVDFSLNCGAASGMTTSFVNLQKNGVNIAYGVYATPVAGTEAICVGSRLVYMNGSTDYLELYANTAGTTVVVKFGADRTYFTAHFVRPE